MCIALAYSLRYTRLKNPEFSIKTLNYRGGDRMIRKCIYCGKECDLSESDIIPDALTNARILNKNVCRIEHNNKFSDMFESKVIAALGFITNELDIKSSKGKKYAPYDATVAIEGKDYNLKLQGDNEIFNGRVMKSSDNKQMISSYDKVVKIAKDERKVQPLDINSIEIKKTVKFSNEIFFDSSMYRMLSKIAFEWYCSKNDISGYYSEFKNIVDFITTGVGTNPVSIIQEKKIYKQIDQMVDLGSHTLLAFEKCTGEIDVIISLFGLLMYRVIVTKNKPSICCNNFLYVELRTDSSRKELIYHSFEEMQQKIIEMFVNGKIESTLRLSLLRLMQDFYSDDEEATGPNAKVNEIFFNQLKKIMQESTLQKKSLKRFVNEIFYEGHKPIQLNTQVKNKKEIILFFAIYLIGLSKEENLNNKILQEILKEGLPCTTKGELIVDNEMENNLKKRIMSDQNYSDVLEKGAVKVINWQ